MERRVTSHTEEEEMNQRRQLLAQARKGVQKAVNQLMELYQVRVYSGDGLKSLKIRKTLLTPSSSKPKHTSAAAASRTKPVKGRTMWQKKSRVTRTAVSQAAQSRRLTKSGPKHKGAGKQSGVSPKAKAQTKPRSKAKPALKPTRKLKPSRTAKPPVKRGSRKAKPKVQLKKRRPRKLQPKTRPKAGRVSHTRLTIRASSKVKAGTKARTSGKPKGKAAPKSKVKAKARTSGKPKGKAAPKSKVKAKARTSGKPKGKVAPKSKARRPR